MDEPIIRLADRADVAELSRLRWEWGLEESKREEPASAEFAARFERFFEEGLSVGRLFVWVADASERLISNLWVEIVDKVPHGDRLAGAWGYVTNVYTEPAHRGRGVGTRLLDVCKDWAHFKGLELLIVWPSDESVEFYKRGGFEVNPMLLELNVENQPIRPSRRPEVVDYDPRWPQMFEEERARLEAAIGNEVEVIEHVGSTAVPGLAAKPIIDMLVGVKAIGAFKSCVRPLAKLGYAYKPWVEGVLPERRYFSKDTDGKRTHHLHMVSTTSSFFRVHRGFRDWLLQHPDDALAYEKLKRELAAKFENIEDYTEGKSEFVRSIVERALREP